MAVLDRALAAAGKICPVENAAELRELLPAGDGRLSPLVVAEIIRADLNAARGRGLTRDLSFYEVPFRGCFPNEQWPIELLNEQAQPAGNSGTIVSQVEGTPQTIQPIQRPAPLQAGNTYDDFRILRQVGRGAFADVYLALQESMQRFVALKVSVRTNEEPQTLSRMDHSNIIRVYDQRSLADPPVNFLYMQFAAGGTLQECMERFREVAPSKLNGHRFADEVQTNLAKFGLETSHAAIGGRAMGRYDWAETVAWIGMQLAQGLDHAHAQGVQHRDIKPPNILLAADGTPLLADFNVSFARRPGQSAATHFGGSLPYMSPEQLNAADREHPMSAQELDGRSDLFSLGMVLWELRYGQRPWSADCVPGSWTEAMEMETRLREKPLPEAEGANDSPADRVLNKALKWSLQTSRERRPATGDQLARVLRIALRPAAAGRLLPNRQRWMQRVLELPVLVMVLVVSLLPNLAASVFNIAYNGSQIVVRYPELWPRFMQITMWMNLVLFPVGVAVVVRMVWSFQKRLKQAGSGTTMRWSLGHRIAMVSGSLWLAAGILFPVLLTASDRNFAVADSLHFFASLTICGGVAMVYPFFGVTLLNLAEYYPRFVKRSLEDRDFRQWTRRLRGLAGIYLLVAAMVPLIALSLLVIIDQTARLILLAAILATAFGFGASFLAVQTIDSFVHDLEPVMDDEDGQRARLDD